MAEKRIVHNFDINVKLSALQAGQVTGLNVPHYCHGGGWHNMRATGSAPQNNQ